MNDKKEVIKALECCLSIAPNCEKCPKRNDGISCITDLHRDALRIITESAAKGKLK